MNRDACGACGGGDLRIFLDLGKTPLANKYPNEYNADETWYPLQLCRCSSCGLVQLMYVVPDVEIYNDDYGFYSGGSAAQREYHRRGAEILMNRYPEQAQRGVFEVACNDGSLLEHFQANGLPSYGIDPATGPIELARNKGLDVIHKALTTAVAQEIREQRGPQGLIIAYNSMAHVENLSDVLTAIRTLMDDDSLAVFEVQYLPDLIAGNMYDQVYHEHRFFYTLSALRHAATLHGLYVADAELIELQGGGLRVTFTPRADVPLSMKVSQILASERWLNAQCVYDGFQGQIERTRTHLQDIIATEVSLGRRIGGYAAAAKACTIMNYCGLRANTIAYVVDSTPYKAGRYVPGTNVSIISPDESMTDPVDTTVILSANYLSAIMRNNLHIDRWVVPLPLPAIL